VKGKFVELMPGLWSYPDTCNVYILRAGRRAVAVDFGSGAWLDRLEGLGIERLDHVFLTHHHADQCAGLGRRRSWPFAVHAPAGEASFLSPAGAREQWRRWRRPPYQPFPENYSPVGRGLAHVKYDVRENSEWYGHGVCLRFVLTPGHTRRACSIVVEYQGRQLCFCGDAVHAGGTVWQPWHLEWEHYTGTGALAAWEGIQRLLSLGLDWILPSHGSPVTAHAGKTLRRLSDRLMRLYRAKGSICSGERDHFLVPTPLTREAWRYLPHLYRFGQNMYLLLSADGQTMAVDPTPEGVQILPQVLREVGAAPPSVAVVTHAHWDHCAGIVQMRRLYGTRLCLHPRVAEVLERADRHYYFGAPRFAVAADELWPERGRWTWREYRFRVAPWPGQTWWHCTFMTRVDGLNVLFGGDSFQPASRWNGTGGFCALNNSRFADGYIPSCRLALRWRPDVMANGHGCAFRFTASRFRRIARWARSAEEAVRALCPTGDLETDYYAARRHTADFSLPPRGSTQERRRTLG
jgi:glyoxylase-like metal-dependent hydrolase (beta-lactamase superfamily II)